MELAKITPDGQIKLPTNILVKLGVKVGDKIIFVEDGNKIILENAAKIAFSNIRTAFSGEAEWLGIKDEDDIVKLVDEIREDMWKEKYADND